MQDSKRIKTNHKEEHFPRCLWVETGPYSYGQAGHWQNPDSQDEGIEENSRGKEKNATKEKKCSESSQPKQSSINFLFNMDYTFYLLLNKISQLSCSVDTQKGFRKMRTYNYKHKEVTIPVHLYYSLVKVFDMVIF